MQTGVLNLYAYAGALAAKMNYTDKDIVHFLTNVECVPFFDLLRVSAPVGQKALHWELQHSKCCYLGMQIQS